MKQANDTRLWLDRVQGQEVFGLFTDQKFYSVEYKGEQTEELQSFLHDLNLYQEWARESFLNARAGIEMPEFPLLSGGLLQQQLNTSIDILEQTRVERNKLKEIIHDEEASKQREYERETGSEEGGV